MLTCATPFAITRKKRKMNQEDQASKRESLAILYEISRILEIELDLETLSLALQLVENGFHPEAVATVVKELRQETKGRMAYKA